MSLNQGMADGAGRSNRVKTPEELQQEQERRQERVAKGVQDAAKPEKPADVGGAHDSGECRAPTSFCPGRHH